MTQRHVGSNQYVKRRRSTAISSPAPHISARDLFERMGDDILTAQWALLQPECPPDLRPALIERALRYKSHLLPQLYASPCITDDTRALMLMKWHPLEMELRKGTSVDLILTLPGISNDMLVKAAKHYPVHLNDFVAHPNWTDTIKAQKMQRSKMYRRAAWRQRIRDAGLLENHLSPTAWAFWWRTLTQEQRKEFLEIDLRRAGQYANLVLPIGYYTSPPSIRLSAEESQIVWDNDSKGKNKGAYSASKECVIKYHSPTVPMLMEALSWTDSPFTRGAVQAAGQHPTLPPAIKAVWILQQ